MEKSFRAILSEFLEENTPEKPVSPSSAPAEMSFFWQSPFAKSAPPPRKNPYPTSARDNVLNFGSAKMAEPEMPSPANVTEPAAPASAKKSEIVDDEAIALGSLAAGDRNLTQVLIALGATELRDGVSEKRLKKAHRRLAKRLHPDMQGSTASAQEKARNQQLFMNLQSAYQALLESLPTYKTANAA